MLYATLTFWLLVAVLSAWGVHHLWSSMLKPRTVNSVLLPGTLVAQLGHVAGLLVTGATVTNTTLYKDESGEPEMTQDPKPRIPVLGPIIIGMLPLVSCVVAIFLVTRYLGGGIVPLVAAQTVPESLPTTLGGFWQLLRDQITLAETALNATLQADWNRWEVWLFVYLLVCLTVRMAPFPGTLRGSLAATAVLGLAAALIASVTQLGTGALEWVWSVLTLAVATLMLLLLASVVVRGTLGLGRMLAGNQ